MRYTHVVFDIDGTLIESGAAIEEGLQLLCERRLGHRLDEAKRDLCLGLPAKEALEAIGLPYDQQTIDEWVDDIIECYDSVRVFEGVPELLDEVAGRGFVVGAVTSQDLNEFERGFSRFGLSQKLGIVITVEDTELHKPDPDPLLEYLRRSGADPDHTLYVGDAQTDATCAAAAGVDFALAAWKTRRPGDIGPAVVRLERPGDLLDYISS